MSRITAVPALESQWRKPTLHVVVNTADPWLADRMAVFRSTGCQVKFIERSKWQLYGEDWELPAGPKIVSRLDDDDVIRQEFCQFTAIAARKIETALIWPCGYVFWRGRIYTLRHPGNQFVSLFTESSDPHQIGHWRYVKEWRSVVVTSRPGWIWVRHSEATTPTLEKYRRAVVGRIEAPRFAVNLRAVHRLACEMGEAPASYEEMNHAQSGL